jgi:hypothetical protein
VRPLRYLWVNARIIARWIVRRLTGRWATLPVYVNREAFFRDMTRRMFDQQVFLIEREKSNRSLLTGMVVALQTGSMPWFTGWQQYKFAQRKRSYAKGVPTKVIGRPEVYKGKDTTIGLTAWDNDYVSRREELVARGRRKYV